MTGPLSLAPGVVLWKTLLARAGQESMAADIESVIRQAPLFTPRMPQTLKPFSVRMSNCGELGWISDARGYRYERTHPDTGRPWPAIPDSILSIWRRVANTAAQPEACLVNFYDPVARMGLHQDRDEADLAAPIVSISLGDSGRFRFGRSVRGGKTQSVLLESGDVMVFGGPARLMFHGVDKILPGSSTLLPEGGRINLTLRRVSGPGKQSPHGSSGESQ